MTQTTTQTTHQLRAHLAGIRARDALTLARTGDSSSALAAAEQCARIDPSLPHPHALAAKIQFWRGDLDEAERRLAEAARRGLDRAQVETMQMAIDDFKARLKREDEARALSNAAWSARIEQIRRGWFEMARWFSDERLTAILFLAVLIVTLIFGGLR